MGDLEDLVVSGGVRLHLARRREVEVLRFGSLAQANTAVRSDSSSEVRLIS